MSKLTLKKTDVTEVISHDVEPLLVHTDARSYSKFGWLLVIVALGGFLLWASFAPLDKGVPVSGVVATESNRKMVQHQTGGTIQEILVKDGDVVKAGQILVRLNKTQVNANTDISRGQYYTALATQARLKAERDGRGNFAMPKELESVKDDPRVVTSMELQRQVMESRRGSLQNELGAIEESIAGLKAQIGGVKESQESKKAQLGFLNEQLVNVRELAKDGYIARSRLLDLERSYAQIAGSIAEDTGNIGRSARQINELQLRKVQRSQDYQKEVRSQLSDVEREAAGLASRMQGQEFEVASTDVKSPVDGTVVNLNVFTVGGVVGSGFRMMDIVPTDDAMIVEGQLPVNLIDKVRVGLPVEMIFSAFNANRTPHIPGKLVQVSADRTVDEHSGAAYYKVRARVSPEGAKIIAGKKMAIQSGMPVEMFIKTGERTMMSYLLKPVFDRANSSMTED